MIRLIHHDELGGAVDAPIAVIRACYDLPGWRHAPSRAYGCLFRLPCPEDWFRAQPSDSSGGQSP